MPAADIMIEDETDGGTIVSFAAAFLVESANEVAVTVTSVEDAMLGGGVYAPVGEIVPSAGAMDQRTVWLAGPVTVAVSGCGPLPAGTTRFGGDTLTAASAVPVLTIRL